jgi:hypothetical protein
MRPMQKRLRRGAAARFELDVDKGQAPPTAARIAGGMALDQSAPRPACPSSTNGVTIDRLRHCADGGVPRAGGAIGPGATAHRSDCGSPGRAGCRRFCAARRRTIPRSGQARAPPPPATVGVGASHPAPSADPYVRHRMRPTSGHDDRTNVKRPSYPPLTHRVTRLMSGARCRRTDMACAFLHHRSPAIADPACQRLPGTTRRVRFSASWLIGVRPWLPICTRVAKTPETRFPREMCPRMRGPDCAGPHLLAKAASTVWPPACSTASAPHLPAAARFRSSPGLPFPRQRFAHTLANAHADSAAVAG